MPEKEPYRVRRDVHHRNFVDFLACVSSYERKQQTERVPVAALRVPS